MLTTTEFIEYKFLSSKFFSTCSHIAKLIHDRVPEFTIIADWRLHDNYVVGEVGDFEYKFNKMLLLYKDATIIELLESSNEAYSIEKIKRN